MNRKQYLHWYSPFRLLFLLFFTVMLSACVTEETGSDTPYGNWKTLWNILDTHYCFFSDKQQTYGLDWDEVGSRYGSRITPSMSSDQLFQVCGEMLRELRDGHVNLTSPGNTARYWDWFENYPANFYDSLQRIVLGKDYRLTQGLKYRILEDNIGYLYCPSFDVSFGSGNLSAVFSYLAPCNGLIVDVRNNSGGLLTSAQALAGCFIDSPVTGGYICHKKGPAHDDFSSPKPIQLEPAKGVRWQKPVVVLINRRCYSAANAFVMFMQSCTSAVLMGNRTGGGCGMPFVSELPNGWGVRFSACPMYDTQMQLTEQGIEPHIHLDISSFDWSEGRDTYIERAREWLNGQH